MDQLDHSKCRKMLIDIGKKLGFESVGKTMGDLYGLANADCVWYYPKNEEGQDIFKKLAEQDGYSRIPIVAFEVAYSEAEKNLRGSLTSLQLLNAAVSVMVLIGPSAAHKGYVERLLNKFALGRTRLWTQEDVFQWHKKIIG
jgi:hypothetical protein